MRKVTGTAICTVAATLNIVLAAYWAEHPGLWSAFMVGALGFGIAAVVRATDE